MGDPVTMSLEGSSDKILARTKDYFKLAFEDYQHVNFPLVKPVPAVKIAHNDGKSLCVFVLIV